MSQWDSEPVKIINHLPATPAELELLQLEKLTESELEMVGYTTTKEFWDRYAYEKRSKKDDCDESKGK